MSEFEAPKPIAQILAHQMRNERYSLIVHRYFEGQFRIQLTDVTVPDMYAPEGHGGIVRELCTYQDHTVCRFLEEIAQAEDPEEFCRSLERDYNCEYPGGRISLDNTPENRA